MIIYSDLWGWSQGIGLTSIQLKCLFNSSLCFMPHYWDSIHNSRQLGYSMSIPHDYKHMLHIHVHLIHASLNLYTVELSSSAYRTPILFYSMSDANQCPRSNSIHILTPLSAELKGSEAARAI